MSTSLKELQSWGLAKLSTSWAINAIIRTHHDVWEMFRVVADERKRREIDPTRELLKTCLEAPAKELDTQSRSKLEAFSQFFETTSSWYEQLRRWPIRPFNASSASAIARSNSSASAGEFFLLTFFSRFRTYRISVKTFTVLRRFSPSAGRHFPLGDCRPIGTRWC